MSQKPQTSRAARPSLLQPPATIISPPSPTDPKTNHSAVFESPLRPSDSPGDESAVEYDSPEDDLEEKHTQPQSSSDHLAPTSNSISDTQLTTSPQWEPSLLHPESPRLSGPPQASSSSGVTPVSPRSPSPSSPHYRPKPLGHRRVSSTHRVRETTDGSQSNTDSGERMVNQYRIGKRLGKGAYASVELAVDVGTGVEYAVKEFSKSRMHYQALQARQRQAARRRGRRSEISGHAPGDDGIGNMNAILPRKPAAADDPLGLIRREIAVMKKLDHPNIVHLYEAISMPNADALFLVLEYMPGGVLMEVQVGPASAKASPPFDLEQTREYFRQLCLGLEYLHANEVIHRDIKPENVLLSADRSTVKLCDFGVSEMFVGHGDDRIQKSGGSPAFSSPESFASHTADVHGKAVDIWALGVTLYCMLTGRLPFNVENPIELFEVVREKSPEINAEWDGDLKDLLNGMLEKEPTKRMEMTVIREHPWTTARGELPMITVDDNLHHLGKHVEEPTQEELGKAIGTLRSIFTVVRAVQKMRRLQLHTKSMSTQAPSSPGSTNLSLTSGSMDSYASNPPGTDLTSNESDEEGDNRAGCASPESMGSPSTERQMSGPSSKLDPIKTDSQSGMSQNCEPSDVALFESPTDGK
ncbi:kinase-like domain-containing protein [Naematelia encephala]|uniref:Kinase-like domain-containing protein n=1 Tax=Naematelia encephala TaxID=71784 RepID=A0A1Y2AYL8_9TREE|nr:kinase-like domain-containing protein [Naematelia encephala]